MWCYFSLPALWEFLRWWGIHLSPPGLTVQKQTGCQSLNQDTWRKPPCFLVSFFPPRPRSSRPLFQLLLGILRDRKSPQAHSFPPEIPNSLAVILSLGFPVLVSRCWPSPRGLTSPYVFHGAHGFTWIWFPVSTNSDLAQMGQNDWNWCWKRRSLSSWNPRVLDIF